MTDSRPASLRSDKPLTVSELIGHLSLISAAYGGDTPISYGTYPIAGGVLMETDGGWRVSLTQTKMTDVRGGF